MAATRPSSTSAPRQAPPPSPTAGRPAIVQAIPRGGYYDILLTDPPPYGAPRGNQPRKAATLEPAPWEPQEAPAAVAARKEAERKTVQERAALVFGSRLAGPIERANRLAEIRKRSTRIAGVLVPPRPTEPDNCCMSGCVNCVWDRYRDEMEEWAAANAEATRRLRAQEGGVAGSMPGAPSPSPSPSTAASPTSSVSMDDDGGGSDTGWSLDEAPQAAAAGGSGTSKTWNDDLYKNVPVGIREFMKQEKRLKMKHLHDEAASGA